MIEYEKIFEIMDISASTSTKTLYDNTISNHLNQKTCGMSDEEIILELKNNGLTVNIPSFYSHCDIFELETSTHEVYLPKHSDLRFKVPDFILGRGQFSTVYKAYDTNTNLFLAYKVAECALEKQRRKKLPRDVKDLRNEVKILRIINPDGSQIGIQPPPYATLKIVKNKGEKCKVVSVNRCNAYLTLLCEGDLSPLKTGVISKLITGINPNEREDLMNQLINGLSYLSKNGLMHGDIKPENIFKNGKNYYLADFGSSRIEEAFTDSSDVVPTLSFMTFEDMTLLVNLVTVYNGEPGEELNKLKIHTGRCDIFALGASICEIFTGRLPYKFKKIQHIGDMANPKSTGFNNLYATLLGKNGIKRPLVNILRQMVVKDPEERPQIKDIVETLLSEIHPILLATTQDKTQNKTQDKAEDMTEEIAENNFTNLSDSLKELLGFDCELIDV